MDRIVLAIFFCHVAAVRFRLVVCPDRQRIVQERDVGQVQGAVLEGLGLAEPLEDRRQQPILATGQALQPACVASGLPVWLVSSPCIKEMCIRDRTRLC